MTGSTNTSSALYIPTTTDGSVTDRNNVPVVVATLALVPSVAAVIITILIVKLVIYIKAKRSKKRTQSVNSETLHESTHQDIVSRITESDEEEGMYQTITLDDVYDPSISRDGSTTHRPVSIVHHANAVGGAVNTPQETDNYYSYPKIDSMSTGEYADEMSYDYVIQQGLNIEHSLSSPTSTDYQAETAITAGEITSVDRYYGADILEYQYEE